MANPINYQKEMEHILCQCASITPRPRLLLHACCGPCSSAVLEQLRKVFDLGVFYYNPNIWPKAEHDRRGQELARFLQQMPGEGRVELIQPMYEPSQFYNAIVGLEQEPERGSRCTVCYRLRLEQAAEYAQQNGYTWFCSTLSISPHKDAARLNQIGLELQEKYSVRWLPSDFKKKEGYKRTLVLSEEYHLYRQEYCGCEFSAAARGISTQQAEELAAEKTDTGCPIE